MKRLILLMISFCAALFVSAQEEIFSDSISVEHGQYKVNDRFKVQTRVSISNRPSTPWEP